MSSSQSSNSTDLIKLRKTITDLVAHNAVAMVQCAIDAVQEEGQYQAIKYLFEMIGLYPAMAGSEDVKLDSLTETLLTRLELENSRQPGETTSGTDTEG
jgi:hypothetical protein